MARYDHEAQRHWSSDFVEHLRTVHFSLVILCLGLVIVSGTQRETAAKRAAAQLSQIVSVAQRLEDGWIESYCEQRKQSPASAMPPLDRGSNPIKMSDHPLIKFVLDGVTHRASLSAQCAMYVILPDTTESRAIFGGTVIAGRVVVKGNPTTQQLNPVTLADFVGLWNALNQEVEIVIPTSGEDKLRTWVYQEGQSPDSGNGPTLAYSIETDGKWEGTAGLELSPNGLGKMDLPGDEGALANLFVFLFDNGTYLRVPTIETIQLNGLSYLTSLVPEESRTAWRRGKFEEAFPELATITKDRQAATFAVWERALKEEVDRETETFEAFGLKLPAQTTTLWGAV